ncbi:uncharacterized protein LOC142339520 isoform X2 [Convolutriloba macropyga]|uniref:uncharacterized protein LOC142339520 isoform X2 n=1 Tax=Convolutriloba macropyga TaxID=536237 RepID=UPI003F521B39
MDESASIELRKTGGNCAVTSDGTAHQCSSGSKLPSMKTARDVIDRIQWDDQLPANNFLVGYLDRFVGVIERPFTSFDWTMDLCDVESGKNPSAVPQHRIQYFKYKDVTVWDKEKRLDVIFGSTGDAKLIINIIDTQGRDQFDFLKYASNCEKEEVVEDVYDVDWAQPSEESQKLNEMDEEEIENQESPSNIAADSDKMNKPKKLQPNYFFCIRITHPDIQMYHKEFLKKYFSQHPEAETLNKCSTDSLHITLGVLRIDKVRHYELAIQLMSDILDLDLLQPLRLPFELEVDHSPELFNKQVAVNLIKSEELMHINERLKVLCKEYELSFIDDFARFNPHMTLLKFKRGAKAAIDAEFLKSADSPELPKTLVSVSEILLCSMGERQDDGFYRVISQMSVNEN